MMILREHPVLEAPAAEGVQPAATVVETQLPVRVSLMERLVQAVFVLSGIVCTMIAVRFLLLALGADLTTPFAAFMLTLTAPLVDPFLGLFGASPTSGPSVLELSSLFAIFIYTVAAYAVVSVLRIGVAPRESRAAYSIPRSLAQTTASTRERTPSLS